jgi:hypothetical protein
MRSLWHWLGTVLLVVAGCRTPIAEQLKPGKQPDNYALPPEDDPRYSEPYKYTKDPNDPSLAPSSKGSGPGGPGMGPRGRGSPGAPGAMGAPPMY